MRISALVIVLLSPAASLAAQNPIGHGVDLAANRFGKFVIASYTGTVSWTWNTGMAVESAEATLTSGQFSCVVSHRSERGAFSANGPGLIEFSLGLSPDSEDSVHTGSRWKGNMYSIQFACPSATPDGPKEARWSHPFETYKQPCGAFKLGATGTSIIDGLPEELFGSWSERIENGDDSEHSSVTWRFCRGSNPCAPLPQPAPGTTPPPRPLPC